MNGGEQPLGALEFFDRAQAARGAEVAGDAVLAALVVGGGSEAAGGVGFEVDAFEVAVEREVEVEAGLLAVGDDVEAGAELVGERARDGVVLEFLEVGVAELVEVLGGELKPAGKRVAADD
jgi:hypothetical protein